MELYGATLPVAKPMVVETDDLRRAKETAVEFEAMFLSELMKPMFANLDSSPPFGGGQAEKIWRSFILDEYGKQIAQAGGIGIADAVMREMISQQEVMEP